ncbi:MAG TPA: TolC family protein [Flavisolibacter sp.]|nr:TolC family protein [Flavisolibacter sp.]
MKQKLFIIPVLFFALAVQSQERLKLEDVFSAIANNHPELKSYDAQIRSLDEASKGAKNWEAPLLSSGFYMMPYNPSMLKKGMNGERGMGQYMLSAEQMFPNKKMQNAEQKYMQSMSSVEKERKSATLNDLYAQAKKNYYQWIVIEKKLKVLSQDEKILDFMIKDAELRYKNNLGKISAYYKAKASLGNIETMRVMLQNEVMQRKNSLNTLMNRDKNASFEIDTNYVIKDYSNLQFDSTAFLNARSDIKAIEREIQIAGLQQDVERAKLKPEFGLRFDHMFGFGGTPMQYSLMGMVRLPMAKWSSRAATANVESLRYKAESLQQEKLAMINEATGMATGMKYEIQARQKQIRLYEDNIIPALKRNFQTVQIAYQNNTEELFELYDAWETLNMTQLQYLDQLSELLTTGAELERILEIK